MLRNRSVLDRELMRLNQDILKLASMVEEALEKAMEALTSFNQTLAHEVMLNDEQINLLRYEIEEESVRLIALQQPAASDLRRIIAAIHIAVELERIGDHAAGIARLVERIDPTSDIETLHQLPKMGKRALKMLRQSIEAFITQDLPLAEKVIARDEKLDLQYGKFVDLMFFDLDQGGDVHLPTYMLWMGHNLERIGDRVTNIAERVIFYIKGEFVELGV